MNLDVGAPRSKAEQYTRQAEASLVARDLDACKRLAEMAIESDPLADIGADRLLAAAEVLLAASPLKSNTTNTINWYSVLGLDSATCNPTAIRAAYRRLALLLRAELNSSARAAVFSEALGLVSQAWSILSDPVKKSEFDSVLEISKQPSTFWTACSSCYYVHLYNREYCGARLRCPNCRQGFIAGELALAPPVVPGTDTYYCSWGILPVGFAGPEGNPDSQGLQKEKHAKPAAVAKNVRLKKGVAKKKKGKGRRRAGSDDEFSSSTSDSDFKPKYGGRTAKLGTAIDINKDR